MTSRIEQNTIEGLIGLVTAMVVVDSVRKIVGHAPVPAAMKAYALDLYISAASLTLAADLGVPRDDVRRLLRAALSPHEEAGKKAMSRECPVKGCGLNFSGYCMEHRDIEACDSVIWQRGQPRPEAEG